MAKQIALCLVFIWGPIFSVGFIYQYFNPHEYLSVHNPENINEGFILCLINRVDVVDLMK